MQKLDEPIICSAVSIITRNNLKYICLRDRHHWVSASSSVPWLLFARVTFIKTRNGWLWLQSSGVMPIDISVPTRDYALTL